MNEINIDDSGITSELENNIPESTNKHTITTVILSVLVAILLGVLAFLLVSLLNEGAVVDPYTSEESQTKVADIETPATIPEQKPNVLFVILDDVGLDYFPGYLEEENFNKAKMPVTESLMKDGYVFANLNTYAMCSPTRASLLTGHHGVETGVLDPGRTAYLDPKWQSIQQEIKLLSNGEITSAVFGKWHLLGREGDISHPNLFVDHYEGIPTGNHESYFSWDKVVNGVPVKSEVYSTTDFTDSAIDWINQQDGQWFTWLAYTAPHTPLHVPPEELHSEIGLTDTQQDQRRNGGRYMSAMLEAVDTELGILLAKLDEETRNNTYIIIIGDNGTGGSVSQEPFKSVGVKGSLHTGGIHTPMVVYNPYQNGNGTEITPLTSTIDFYPTILDIFDLETNQDLPGSSFYPLIADSDESHDQHDFIFSQHLEAATVRSETHRLIRTNEGVEELYNLNNDPFEENNLLTGVLTTTDQQSYTTLASALDSFLTGNY